MTGMGKHAKEVAMETRARVSAWLVFIGMAGTTMSFQVYHSIKHGEMPWPLAGLYGVVPLAISMLLIEVVSGWGKAPQWIRWAAYLIIGGAMFLSASATGAVVLKAAPPHSSLLFGLLLDGAAILSARFLMTSAKAADTAAEAEATLAAALAEERSARLAAEAERDTARQVAADTAAKAEATLAAGERRKADAADTATPRPPRRKSDTATPKPAVPKDVDKQAEALAILDAEPDISGSELGRRLGVQASYGRRLKQRLEKAAPGGGG